jgi:hypothetical protein
VIRVFLLCPYKVQLLHMGCGKLLSFNTLAAAAAAAAAGLVTW